LSRQSRFEVLDVGPNFLGHFLRLHHFRISKIILIDTGQLLLFLLFAGFTCRTVCCFLRFSSGLGGRFLGILLFVLLGCL
jgi:hypothetical protein